MTTTAVLMSVLALLIGATLGLVFGLLVGRLRAQPQRETLQNELAGLRAERASEAEQKLRAEELLQQSELRLKSAFDEIAGNSLKTNSELFLQLARESLGREQVNAQGALLARETAITQLIEPIRAALEKTATQVATIERERQDSFATLRTQIEALAGGQLSLQRETRNLVTALRRPEVRGRWGEMTLRRVVELAGMSEHCDFTEQMHVEGEDGALRPDLIVHMPDERDLVVDAKAPLDAYLEAMEAPTDEARRIALLRHASQVEKRIRELGSKSYWAQFARSPEFAVLFVPGEQFLGAALAERPELMDSALKQGVILATPATLMALLKTVAFGWRQAKVAENAELIRELGQALHKRLATFTGHLATVGKRLGGAVEAYNQAVGSLERQVLPGARRFGELGVTADQALPLLEPVEILARQPDAGSDSKTD
ncbi:MAG TPA: DNA recombination protein RmuC [Steroidobacteraceae bacterium]|jgi:DNA recombination protein RmuC|nr:DNA recombination protein RmuC [Steroidobacteraceae bacterium]